MDYRKSFMDLSRQGKWKRLKVSKGKGSTQSLMEMEVDIGMEDEAVSVGNRFENNVGLGDFENSGQLSTSVCDNKRPNAKQVDGIPMTEILNPTFDESSSDSDINLDEDPSDNRIDHKIRNWAEQFKISTSALTALLFILRAHQCFNFLPKDGRTLRHTPREVSLKDVSPGQYFHIGIAESLERMLRMLIGSKPQKVELLVGIDGFSLFKSSGSEVWPILGRILNIPSLCKKVFPIGVFYGSKKPTDCSAFLNDFVEETVSLTEHGVDINGEKVLVTIKGVCCDAPAKAFVLGVKGHAGYYSCTRCKQKGVRSERKVVFPELHSPARTHEDFLNKTDPEYHHNGDTALARVPDFDFIRSVPLDYMHLVCLGVVRTLLCLWNFGDPPFKLQSRVTNSISTNLISMRAYIPSEFCRRPRMLNDLKRWKATEFRQFLLYTGPVVLYKSFIHEHKDLYDLFITLHIAMTILLSPNFCHDYNKEAKKLIEIFIVSFKNLYGIQFMTHNFHNLIHLADDVSTFGNLDNCSAFQFENFLQTIKKMVRKGDRPLQQIAKRLIEQSRCDFSKTDFQQIPVSSSVSTPHTNGKLPEGYCQNTEQFKKINFESFIMTTETPNNCCSLSDGSVIVIHNVIFSENLKCHAVVFKRFLVIENFFDVTLEDLEGNPACCSSMLGIFKVDNLSTVYEVCPITCIKHKLIRMPLSINTYLVIPLLHVETL